MKRIKCNDSSFKVLGAIGDLSFSKSCKCIHKSKLGSWKSSLGQLFDSITATNEQSNKWTKSRTNLQTNQTNGFGCRASNQPFTEEILSSIQWAKAGCRASKQDHWFDKYSNTWLCHDKKPEPASLADQEGIDEEIEHPLLQLTVPKISGKQHQSNLIPVNCGNLPKLKS